MIWHIFYILFTFSNIEKNKPHSDTQMHIENTVQYTHHMRGHTINSCKFYTSIGLKMRTMQQFFWLFLILFIFYYFGSRLVNSTHNAHNNFRSLLCEHHNTITMNKNMNWRLNRAYMSFSVVFAACCSLLLLLLLASFPLTLREITIHTIGHATAHHIV